ncbi:hypothetical protein K2173_016389 [Erythroxylum novogranatense]|uniref:C3H1-type domain-containing protein n=1 Tax=Erythroxylum novogranatense TaxID=1862640 RepID=A0AAV8SGL7_9ROSI|nr:hypothetical protein K2173_016389 [Erythroxylum novogranatense]
MCGCVDQFMSQAPACMSTPESNSLTEEMTSPIGSLEKKHSFSLLLELAADNDVEGLKRSICEEFEIREVGFWYGRNMLSKKMILEQRTPLMIAAKYGSIDVVRLILLLPEMDTNFSCGTDKSTALHCAASGGSINAVTVVKMLLLAGADPNAVDANGHRPVDVVAAPPKFPSLKTALEELLRSHHVSGCEGDLHASVDSLSSISLPTSFSSEDGLVCSSTSAACKRFNISILSSAEKELPVDPFSADITDHAFTTDEFRMFSFKVLPCSRAYSHDWTECPFVHPGENARRRDPRKFNYSSVPCPDYRKGACRRGDMCEYAHGIFECWLHPAQYRTRFCKDGTKCKRYVCFFAHAPEELRPLYATALPSPRPPAIDYSPASTMFPGSIMAVTTLPPSPSPPPPMPPSDSVSYSTMAWQQQSVSNFNVQSKHPQASRLRTSLNARDVPTEELNALEDFELHQKQFLNENSYASQPNFGTNSPNRSACSIANSDKCSSAKLSACSPSYKLAVLSQPHQQRNTLNPLKKIALSPKNPTDLPSLQAPIGPSSPRRVPQTSEPVSPVNCESPFLGQQQSTGLSSWDNAFSLCHHLRSNNEDSWPKQECGNGNSNWPVQVNEWDNLHQQCSIRLAEEPDVSWVQSVLKEPPGETKEIMGSKTKTQSDVPLQAWLDGLQLDQILAQ